MSRFYGTLCIRRMTCFAQGVAFRGLRQLLLHQNF